jgi:hypothetical protein
LNEEDRVRTTPNGSIASCLRLGAQILGVLPAILLAACGSSATAPSATSTSFSGVIASQTLSGSLAFDVATTTLNVGRAPTGAGATAVVRPELSIAPGDVTVTGTLTLVGTGPIALTGTYNTSSHALALSGGGYTFTGTYASGRLTGTVTGPAGSGTFAAQPTGTATIRNYCGTYAGHTDNGRFNMSVNVNTNTVAGAWASAVDGTTGTLTGTVSGSSVSVDVGGSGGTVVTGSITSTGVTGTYTTDGGGTVTGSLCP